MKGRRQLKKGRFVFILFITLTLIFISLKVGAKDSFNTKIQTVIDKEVIEQEVPGIQAYIKTKEDINYITSGYTTFEKENEVTKEHAYRVGSITKLFTSVLVMKLYEEGEISLDNKLEKWYPDFPNADQITIKQLLNHNSGIYNYTENLWISIRSIVNSNKEWDPEHILNTVYDEEFYFKPGESHYYSNTNYLILGLIIEKVTDKSLKEVYREYIFGPLELNNTYFLPGDKIPDKLVTGFERDVIPFGIQKFTSQENSFASLGFAAGGMVTTAEELTIFLESIFKTEYLEEETVKMMNDYLLAADPDVKNQIGYGLGLRVLKIKGDILYGHTGTIPGFGAAAFYCPQENYSISYASNISLFDQVKVLEGLIAVINKSE